MKKVFKRAFFACARAAAELVMLFPVLYLFSRLLMGQTPMLWIFLAQLLLAAVMGALTRVFIQDTALQLIAGLPLCLAFVILTGMFCGGVWPNAYILPVILTPLVYYRGKQHAQSTWDAILPNFVLFAALVIQLIIIVLVRLNGSLTGTNLTMMYISVPIAYVTAFIVLNRINIINLIDEAKSRSSSSTLSISGGMAKQNSLLLAILLIIGAALSLGTVLYTAATWVVEKLGLVLSYLFKLLFSVEMPTGGGGGGRNDMEILSQFDVHSGNMEFWGPFFTVISYIGVAVVFVGFVILVYRFVRWLIRAINGVIAKFAEQGQDEDGDGMFFEDTRETLVDLSQLPGMYADAAKERLQNLFRREPGYDDMPTPAEKLKYLFRKSLSKAKSSGYNHRPSLTAQEALKAAGQACPEIREGAPELADSYDRLRYAGREPEGESVDKLREKLGNL